MDDATSEAANRFIADVRLAEHIGGFAVAAEEPDSAFVACRPAHWREVVCRHERCQVGRNNTVRWKGRALQIPPSRLRSGFVKTKVRLHAYPDGAAALFWGPHRIAEFPADAATDP